MPVVLAILRPFIFLTSRLLFRIRFIDAENVPATGACIITPNHITYADPIWVTIPIHRPVHYMTWDKVFEIPGLGFIARLFGAFPVKLEGTGTAAQREAVELLRRGRPLMIFPEGGRTRTGRVMPFKMGAFRLALAQGVPIVPVAIDGAWQIWPAHRLLPRPGKLTIKYFPAINVQAVPDEIGNAELKLRARELAKKTHDIVARHASATLEEEVTEQAVPLERSI
jgi:1-acyl-sn-glycerol-3-phosphate acyltransferase